MNPTQPTAPASMATHTPTPWTTEPQDAAREEWVIFHASGAVARVYKGVLNPEGDAQFIVRACNSHAQLVAALDRASMVAEYANRLSCCKTIKEATDAKLYSKLATALVEFREARAALTAAQS